MGDLSQKKGKKKLTEKTPANVLEQEHILISSKISNRFLKIAPPSSVVFQFSEFGIIKTNGHQCLCDMESRALRQLDVFFKKAQQNMCDVGTFLSY
jgi:hypothetical protein